MLKTLLKEGNLSFIALIVLLLLVWFGGEVLGVDSRIRAGVCAAALALWLILYIIGKVMAARSAALIERRLQSQAQAQIASVRPDRKPEVEALKSQLDEALQSLKASKMGKGALHALPWYIIIGPPGSGKSTALMESGLDFPYMRDDSSRVRGIGGTRNCDWWLASDGILLDTAGRYTTEAEDQDEWLAFLDMLKKARKRKPINGALVCVSIPEILEATEDEMEAHAKKIRDRLDELTRRLELVFPVYLVFTKCDLLGGFVEFYEDFGKEQRQQVWGCTLPFGPAGTETHKDIFKKEFAGLYEAACAHRLRGLAKDRPPEKKRRIFQFPLQFGLARRRLADFVSALFRPNPFQENPVLRGFYFTSGTQEGNPIDQVISAMGDAFGLGSEGGVAGDHGVDKKSYFIHDLFTEIIFPDQNLAGLTSKAAKRQRILRYAAAGVSVVALVLLVIAFGVSFVGNLGVVASARGAVTEVLEREAGGGGDLTAEMAALEELRVQLDRLDRYDREGPPTAMRWGLYRGGDLNEIAMEVYFRRLTEVAVKPCAERLRAELEEKVLGSGRMGAGYMDLMDVYIAYQMMTGSIDREEGLLLEVLGREGRWSSGEIAARHLAFWAASPEAPEVSVGGEDFAQRVDRAITGNLWIAYTYEELLQRLEAKIPETSMPPRITKAVVLGGVGVDAIDVDYEFSSLFTQKGYDDYIKFALEDHSQTLSAKLDQLQLPKEAEEIEDQLRERYRDDYVGHWEEFVKRLKVVPFRDLEDAAEKLKVLSGPASPLPDLVRRLREMQAIKMTKGEKIKDLFDLEKAKKLFGRKDDGAAPAAGSDWVDTALGVLRSMQQEMDRLVRGTTRGNRILVVLADDKRREALDKLGDAVGKARSDLDELRQIPNVEGQMLDIFLQAVDHSRQALVNESKGEINDHWKENIHKVWVDQFASNYPFSEGTDGTVAMREFSRLFNPKSGLFWEAHKMVLSLERITVDETPLITPTAEFEDAVEAARALSLALFGGGGEAVSVHFFGTLVRGEGVVDVKLTLGDQAFAFYDNPSHRGELIFGEGNTKGTKLEIRVGGRQGWVSRDPEGGDWAFLRLIEEGGPQSEDGRTFRMNWEIEAEVLGKKQTYQVEMILEADDEKNPFHEKFFGGLRIPETVCP